jgi:hypothetical protein
MIAMAAVSSKKTITADSGNRGGRLVDSRFRDMVMSSFVLLCILWFRGRLRLRPLILLPEKIEWRWYLTSKKHT